MDVKMIADRFKEAGVRLGGDDTWKVQGKPVIKHSALERLAAGCSISFDAPQVLRSEADECVIVVTGRMGDKVEWSIGEARIGLNYRVSGNQAGYPYAMAEKRAKDRVIIKLVGLHGVYSSEESDDFRDAPKDDARPATAAPPRVTSGQQQETPFDDGESAHGNSPGTIAATLCKALQGARTPEELAQWKTDNREAVLALPKHYKADVVAAFDMHMERLETEAGREAVRMKGKMMSDRKTTIACGTAHECSCEQLAVAVEADLTKEASDDHSNP